VCVCIYIYIERERETDYAPFGKGFGKKLKSLPSKFNDKKGKLKTHSVQVDLRHLECRRT